MTLEINIGNTTGLVLNNDMFDDNGYQFNQELCTKPIEYKYIKSNPNKYKYFTIKLY